MRDPFSPDTPHGADRERAVRYFHEIIRVNPDCDQGVVAASLDHWLRTKALCEKIAAHVQELDRQAKQLARDADELATVHKGLTSGVLAAACKRN